MKTELLLHTSMGDPVTRRDESIIIEFKGKRNVVSTSNLNGGYRENLLFAYNNSCGKNPLIKKHICPGMKGKTLEEHYAVIASELGLPPNKTTGMGTAALTENVAITTKTFNKLTVTAIATAGIDVNGGSAGDLARHNEFTKEPINKTCGTINIFLLIDAKMSAGVLTRTHMTATEAKSVAIRELAGPSMYSEEPATGSGTDSLIAIGNLESDIELHGAGKHCILGQLIGQSVKEAIKEAFDKQCGMNPTRQASMVWQGKRYGITEEVLYESYKDNYNSDISMEIFLFYLQKVTTNNDSVGYVVALFHTIDQHRWGILSERTLNEVGLTLLNKLRKENHLQELDFSNIDYKTIILKLKKTIIEVTQSLI